MVVEVGPPVGVVVSGGSERAGESTDASISGGVSGGAIGVGGGDGREGDEREGDVNSPKKEGLMSGGERAEGRDFGEPT